MLYFAYGSNLLVERLTLRAPSVQVVVAGHLPRHTLRFHKRGSDGSGKCDAFATDWPRDQVLGMIYDLGDEEKALLDEIEGLGQGYEEHQVELETVKGRIRAFTYRAEAAAIDPGQTPYDWYLRFVLAGAIQHQFPPFYQATIRAVASRPDPDHARTRRNHGILEAAVRAGLTLPPDFFG